MSEWQRLELTSVCSKPSPKQLVALRKSPVNGQRAFEAEVYGIGYFQTNPHVPSSRKLWWYGAHGCQDTTRTIWWRPVHAFDSM